MSSGLNILDSLKERLGIGLIVPMVTPFDADGGQVDETGLRALVRFLVRAGANGLVPCGTTGEWVLLSQAERLRITEIVVEEASGQALILPQTGAFSTQETVLLTRHAQDCGADGVAIVSPSYYRLSDAALIAHYTAVAEAVPGFPVFLYNIPQNTGNNLSPSVVAEVTRRCPNVAGIKDSSGNLAQMAEYRRLVARRFFTLVGSDRLILAAMAGGADGAVAGNANAFPEPFISLLRAFSTGDWNEARRAQERVTTIARLLGDGSDLSLFKAMLRQRGLPIHRTVRPPLLTASEEDVKTRLQALEAAGISLTPVSF